MRFVIGVLVLFSFVFSAHANEPLYRTHCELEKRDDVVDAKWTLLWFQERLEVKFDVNPAPMAGDYHSKDTEHGNAVGYCVESYVQNEQERVRFYSYESQKELSVSFEPCKASGDTLIENMTSFVPERGKYWSKSVKWEKKSQLL